LALPVLARGVLRRNCPIGEGSSTIRYVAGVFAASLTASCVFFLVSNFGSWIWFDMYERSLAGVVQCYVSALPFFRYTLVGDLIFSAVLFGGFAAAVASGVIAHRPGTYPATSVN
jgi:hypothetical protein